MARELNQKRAAASVIGATAEAAAAEGAGDPTGGPPGLAEGAFSHPQRRAAIPIQSPRRIRGSFPRYHHAYMIHSVPRNAPAAQKEKVLSRFSPGEPPSGRWG